MRGETTAQYFGDYPNMPERDRTSKSPVADCTIMRECRALETRQKRASPVQYRRAAPFPANSSPWKSPQNAEKGRWGVAAFSYERNEEKEVLLS